MCALVRAWPKIAAKSLILGFFASAYGNDTSAARHLFRSHPPCAAPILPQQCCGLRRPKVKSEWRLFQAGWRPTSQGVSAGIFCPKARRSVACDRGTQEPVSKSATYARV